MIRDLVEPLWLPLVVLAAVWVAVFRARALSQRLRIIGAMALGGLWFVATPFVALVLETPLAVESTIETNWQPDYIYVLAAGFDLGDSPAEDSSGLETIRRVNRAVMLWRDYPTATLVMAGNQPGSESLRPADQQGNLMRKQAERLGVPTESILIDSVSTNTNGHAKVARDAGFLTPTTPLAIVTSDFHLRRARREFSRFFTDIRTVGADPDITDTTWGDIGITSFFPRVEALRNTTVYLREYVALLLSDLRN